MAAGPSGFLGLLVLGAAPGLAEAFYGRGLGPRLSGLLGRLSGQVDSALSEICLLAAVLAVGLRVVIALRRPPRGRRLLGAGLDLLSAASVLLGLFYLLWGWNYARPPLAQRLQWPPVSQEILDTVPARARDATRRVNRAYIRLHGVEDLGRPTPAPSDWRSLDRILDRAWSRIDAPLLPAAARSPRGPAKALRISPLLLHLGLSGFYFPFTGEANLNATVPAARRAFVMAHEKAHQRGIAPEDEANFMGWWAASLADDPLLRYSSALFAAGQLRALAHRVCPDSSMGTAPYLPGVQRDLDDLRRYWRRGRHQTQEFSRRVNDRYLRANRVAGGIESYFGSALLLLRLADRQGAAGAPRATASPFETGR